MIANKFWWQNSFLFHSSLILAISFFVLSFRIANSQVQQGYDVLDGQTETLQYRTLEQDEHFDSAESCYSQNDLARYPEIIGSFNTQAICFDKYSSVDEFQRKISMIDESLFQLNAYKKSSEKTLANIQEILANLKAGQYQNTQIDFFILPKGQITKNEIEKTVNHKPLCKFNSTFDSKYIVQSCQIKKTNFNSFQIINKDQTERIFRNIVAIQAIFKNNNGQKLGILDSISLISKASTLSNDLIVFDSQSFFELNSNNNNRLNEIVSTISINITDNNARDQNNPSNKVVKFNLQYPSLNDKLQVTNQNIEILPSLTLEKFIKEVDERVQIKIKDRIKEYGKLISELEKSKKTQEEGIATTKKDARCFDQTKIQEAENVDLGPKKLSMADFAKNQANKIWRTIIYGAQSTYNSVTNKTVDIISFTPTPTPETPISKFLKTVDNNSQNYSPNVTPTFSPTIKSGRSSVNSNTGSGSKSGSTRTITNSSPTPSPSITANPTRTPTPSPSPSQSPTRTPTPTPSPSASASPSSTPSPSPSPTPSISSSPTPTPTTTPTPSVSIKPSPTPSPTPSNQAYYYSSSMASTLYSTIYIMKLINWLNK